VYLPDFITSARRLLMFSWLFFCGVAAFVHRQAGEQRSLQHVAPRSEPPGNLPVRCGICSSARLKCSNSQGPHRLLGRGGHHFVELASFSALRAQGLPSPS
jgi:hypothetical protein